MPYLSVKFRKNVDIHVMPCCIDDIFHMIFLFVYLSLRCASRWELGVKCERKINLCEFVFQLVILSHLFYYNMKVVLIAMKQCGDELNKF